MKLVVLGGCGGIGRALVSAARAAQHKVIVIDLASSITQHPPSVRAVEVDVTRPETLDAAAEEIGDIDGFVNLCGFMAPPQPVAEYPPALWDELLSGNLTAAYHASRAFAPRIASGGALVHVGSGLGHNARPGFGAYAVSKAGIAALTRQLALELAPRVRVNCVAPSAVDTWFLRGGTGRSQEGQPPPIDVAGYAAAIPMGRIARPDDVTGPILFLLGDEARYVTGQVLHVNGGAYMP